MSEMGERVAEVIRRGMINDDGLDDIVRAVFEAMREPDEQLLTHAFMTVDHTIESIASRPDAQDQIKALWQAMIDEALK